MGAVCVCDKTKLVDACDESAEEEEVDEGDEDCRALGCREADERVEGPEDGEGADDE